MNPPVTTAGTQNTGGSRAGLFRTPISGGVQSATSSHGLPHPAVAVRNLIEQVLSFDQAYQGYSYFNSSST